MPASNTASEADPESESDPRVQIPVSADYHGLSIDGEFVNAIPQDQIEMDRGDAFFAQHHGRVHEYLPPEASKAYWGYMGTENRGRVYQCQECGYLTMSGNAGAGTLDPIECRNCDDAGRPGVTKWRNVYPKEALVNIKDEYIDEVYVDVPELDYDDVPNHKSHLGRIQSQLADYVPKSEMLDTVATAVKDARANGRVDY